MRLIITIIIMMATAAAHAGITNPTYVNIGGTSFHFDSHGRRWGFNESNPGAGLTWADVDLPGVGRADVSIGHYDNSLGRDTVYDGIHKLPYHVAGGNDGLTAVLATGYDWPVIPIVAPTICWTYVCGLITPPIKGKTVGMASLQFRLPIN